MKAYDLLAYLLEHTQPGSIVVVTTPNNIPIMLDKEDEFSVLAYVCKDEDVKKLRETFDKSTIHRAVLGLLSQLSDYLQTQIDELNIANSASYPGCVEKGTPRQREVKREKPKPKKEDIKFLIEQMRTLPEEFDILPLLSRDGKLISLVMQNLSLTALDNNRADEDTS